MFKKNGITQKKIEYWVIPPHANGEFVASMEEVLATYALPYDPSIPVVCMDEQPFQLLRETRRTIPATAVHPKRVDYEYERAGTASIFLFAEPLACLRFTSVRPRRTKVDWAKEVAHLLDTQYVDATKVILVCDNLNTHSRGAFYEAFPPAEAAHYLSRLEIRYTPKHGSWLNIAESELSALTRQCTRHRRLGSIEDLRDATDTWSSLTNGKQRGVDWQFRVGDARIKLKSLYPKIIV